MAPGRKMLGGKNKPPHPPSVLPDPAATPCLPPRSKTMALGGNSTHSRHPSVHPDEAAAMEMPEEEDMDLSTSRARNIMRNNRFANQLGEDVAITGDCVTTGTGRTSKRVLAPENLEETMRCTRQRAMKQVSTTSLIEATEVGLEPDLSANQNQGTLIGSRQVETRGKSMGKEIDSISKGLGTMIPIIVKEGKRRPEAPMQAAKLASESGIIIRQHIPIYPSWTDYKNDSSQLDNLKGKLKGKFSIDIHSDPVIAAMEDILRCGTRQMRYRLKKKYFDGVPANQVRTTSPLKCMTDEQWTKLVDLWSSPEHKDKCAKNQLSREKVQFQQCIGSRSYIAHAYVVKQEKYKDSEPTAIDLFKELHCSKTKGFSEPVKKAIVKCDYRNEGIGTARSSGAGTLTGSRQVEPRGKSMGTAIDSEPTAIDLFKELHCSKTKGFSEPVKKAIEDKHAREALTSPSVEDGQQAKTSIEAVSKSNTFLRNFGIQQPTAKTTNYFRRSLKD
uniref:Transposase Tnp1/En/Spm-like domain-containing protein n=1 Tax=Oryza meridionalis TaxID=40149 RepID=A0A0E0EV75_9ORYZ